MKWRCEPRQARLAAVARTPWLNIGGKAWT